MAIFSGQPSIISRMLGMLDVEDETNLPIGVSALVKNCCFDQLTSVRTRDGILLTMQGVNKAPITGLIGALYTPETASDTFLQVPTIFDFDGALQYESPVGTGIMQDYTSVLFTPPANSHMIACQTYNKIWAAFSNLLTPVSQMAVADPKTKKVYPYGMKPFGWTWTASTEVFVGEMSTPASAGPTGNGHTYRCIQAGTTGAAEPTWPTTDGGTVNDGTAQWQEYTAVMANRIEAPSAPTLALVGSGGTFAANQDVYIVIALANGMGITLPSTSSMVTTVAASSSVNVTIPTLAQLPSWLQELVSPYAPTGAWVYVASVAHGAAAPAIENYAASNTSAVVLGSTFTCTGPGSGSAPQSTCTARVTPGQLPTPDTQPIVERVPGSGTFPAGRDIYFRITFNNASGETPAGPASSVAGSILNDAVQVTLDQPEDENGNALYSISTIGLYECDVAAGQPAPAASEFQLVGRYTPGTVTTVSASATGSNPPTSNTTGAAGNIEADSSTGGINGTQGYRYAALMFMNQNYSVSGFTAASVIKYAVDEDGWELGIFNVAPGPSNVIARLAAFTVADGTQDGGFWWLGNINPQVPSQNFVYPQTLVSNTITQSATVLYDNVTTSGTFNFTDQYLQSGNNVTDRLDVIWPNQAVHVTYCPSVDRIFQTGVPGYYSGWWVSLAADPESYYADTSFITVGSDDGERAWGVCEYRGTIYGLRERSGFTLSASPANPQQWAASKRWGDVGPCGPRAFDSCGEVGIVFVHRSGIYLYEETSPELVSKEIPWWWKTVNWLYAWTICVKIDHERHEVHVLVPVGNSTVPNMEVVINYLEGWQFPIHFSTYSGKEISMDACRKYSINDVQAWVCDRIERNIANTNYPYAEGEEQIPFFDKTYAISQFVYGSSGPDGAVMAVTPGIFHDGTNDSPAGIDCQYETVCPQTTMALIKIEGFSLNARGNGTLYPYFLSGREMVTGYNDQGQPDHGYILKCRTVDLTVDMNEGISRMVPSKISERWRIGFSNGKVPDAWFSLKWLSIYAIPFANARPQSQVGG